MEHILQSYPEDARRIGEEYLSSLTDLNCNSKPLINMLTMLAEENINFAQIIVRVVEYHISQVPPEFKLPILYLIDSIIKNVKSSYVQLFGQCIVNIFLNAFESVQHSPSSVLEKVRERMYLLRQTWNEVFPPTKMYALDVKVKRLDNNWPITAKPIQPNKIHVNPAIHVNPDFLKTGMVSMPLTKELPMEEMLQVKTRELLELKKRKLELELEQTNMHLMQQERQIHQTADTIGVAPPGMGMPAPVVAALRPPGMEPAATVVPPMYPGSSIRPPVRPMMPVVGQQSSFANKPKVHPVNPAMVNTVRPRDPRLARQMQPQQMAAPVMRSVADPRLVDGSHKSGSAISAHKSSRSRSKSPTRSSSKSKSSSSSNHHSSSSSNRKRSESKSSTSSSGSGDGTRHKISNISSQSPTKRSSSSRYAHNGNGNSPASSSTTSSSSKRKSSSPAAASSSSNSPLKSMKRNQSTHNKNTHTTSRSKSSAASNERSSRSRSPVYSRDVDMRSVERSKSPEPKAATATQGATPAAAAPSTETTQPEATAAAPANDLEKRPRPSTSPHIDASSMDVDLRPMNFAQLAALSSIIRPTTPPPPAITTATVSKKATTTTITADTSSTTTNASSASNATATTTSNSCSSSKLPTKVSFKIQKPFNKLEKSTANLSTATLLTATTTTTTAAAADTTAVSSKQSSPAPASSSSATVELVVPLGNKGAGEKRSAVQLPTDADSDEDDKLQQPQQKRSKSAKLDALFGSEDVDLRRALPAKQPMLVTGGVIVVEDDSMDNWEVNKQTAKPLSPVKKPTLDELRAKLAKTVRHNNKLSKLDKSKDHVVAQRLKLLSELKSNDDSQEAHDEKMRTILSQAQEMFENHGMNQEQYKDLVTKVVVMNESSKGLKEMRRREAAAAAVNNDEDDLEMERNAARDAVLRKRIPKLKGNENHHQHATGSPRSDGEPRYEEQQPEKLQQQQQQAPPKQTKTKRDGKRRKPSKWGEQVDPAAAQRAAWQLQQQQQQQQQNNNNNNNNNKRMPQSNILPGGGGFRGMPWQHPPLVMQQAVAPPPPQPPSMLTMPPVPPVVNITKAINSLDNPMADVVRSITIDGGSKEIRFYNQVAIIFMDGDEPHEIGFQQGQRAIYIDHNNEPLALSFNDDYKPFQLDGQLHRIRFGHPSRELYIDDHWYEIYFGGPPVSLPIGNKLHVLKAEGPPPNVDIGRVRRDLVVGKINMIVDAHTIVPLFLDGRQQTFHLGAEQHSLQFVDSFLYALLDGQLQKLEYGGLPKSMKLNGGRNCFIRFGTLPKSVQAGKTHVQDMVYIKTEAPAEPPQPPPLPVVIAPAQPPPIVNPLEQQQPAVADVASAVSLPDATAALSNLNIDELFKKLVSSGIIGAPAAATVTATTAAGVGANKPVSSLPALEASSTVSKDAAAVAAPSTEEPIKRIDLQKPDTIKTRQAAVIATLYLGMQCSSCGVRFPPEQTIKYSQHLDWHFRQNRRERDSTRKTTSSRWFYDLNDWRQYEEIEDIEERERNFLESQGQQLGGLGPNDGSDEVSQQRSLDSPVPSCAAGAEDVDRSCDMCHERFEQFYNEELEEWHLRSAIRVDEKTYHPLCYEDYKASLNPPAPVVGVITDGVESSQANGDVDMLNLSDDNAMDTLIKLEDDSDDGKKMLSVDDDDDDDVIVLPNEEPSVTEIVDDDDDEEYVPATVTRTAETELGDSDEQKDKPTATSSSPSGEQDQQQQQEKDNELEKKELDKKNANESDVDVEIQEPNIPFTDLDTYVEKEPMPMLQVKIKEEPKDDDEEDEDDGFEDVGTVVQLLPLPEDEISIHSSETQTQTIESSASPATLERPASVASLSLPAANEDELELESLAAATTEADFNGENAQEAHNLSAAGLAPALPLASIVNKIKINITKNTSSNSHNSASTTTTTTTMTPMTSADSSQVSAISVIGYSANADGQHQQQQQQNSIQTISTIPVLCGGNTFVPKIATSSSNCSTNAPPSNISSISVIGSTYGSSNNNSSGSNNGATHTTTSSMGGPGAATAAATSGTSSAAGQKSTTPPPPKAAVEAIDPEPVIELKPALRNVTLKKTKKVQNGVETSGLCSIM
ncbi:uncharacterized protein LOC6569091 [Drosophila grimshawi]|uniref:Pre-mRNA cleavage complex 2 protein Pcf11 n=1 Tax=Drosophila grimshawi TaxID=7222 RepID=B4JW77_DROGR|nr:uncharacterized protein LOC6569091 [Drosophila grimshawi]EDV98215.1 GH22985 [Drosophila grimshawi]